MDDSFFDAFMGLRIDLHLDDWHAEFAGGKLEWSINNVEDVDLSPGSGMMVFDAEVVV